MSELRRGVYARLGKLLSVSSEVLLEKIELGRSAFLFWSILLVSCAL